MFRHKHRIFLFLLALSLLNLCVASQSCALEREVKISVYQGPCKDGDFPANLAVAREVIKEALGQGSDFLALPETFLSGYDSREHMEQGARSMDDPDVQALIAESASHGMVVLAGLARRTPEGIYNSVLVIHRGKLLGIYDKVLLTGGDRDNLKFLPGRDVPVFEANGARFAVVICHDSSFPTPALLARLRRAEILFTPHYNAIDAQRVDAHRHWVRNCHVGLACQMKMAVARANVVVTDSPGRPGYGDSFILSPMGEPLAQADLFRTGLISAVLGPEMFKIPYVWSDLSEVPAWMNRATAEALLQSGGQ